jgi:hypothetical protein
MRSNKGYNKRKGRGDKLELKGKGGGLFNLEAKWGNDKKG